MSFTHVICVSHAATKFKPSHVLVFSIIIIGCGVLIQSSHHISHTILFQWFSAVLFFPPPPLPFCERGVLGLRCSSMFHLCGFWVLYFYLFNYYGGFHGLSWSFVFDMLVRLGLFREDVITLLCYSIVVSELN